MAFINLNKGILALLLVTIYQTSVKGIERETVTFNFYGYTVNISYDFKLNDIRYESAVEQFIKRFDEKVVSPHNVSLIEDINKTATNFGLDDVGKTLLVNAFTAKAFAHQPQNFRTLVKWYILYQDSMDVMLCYDKTSISLYGRMDAKPYGTGYLMKDGKVYTDLSFIRTPTGTGGKVYEYVSQTKFTTSPKIFKLNRNKYPKLDTLTKTKSYAFEFAGKKYNYTFTMNKSLILYLKDLPIVELGSIYVNYGFSEALKNTLIKQLRQTIDSMGKREALGFLLKFVQDIPYKTDEDYLGFERYSFSEEVLYNDFADCEDKVILYAALVKELLGVQSVALVYENDEHVAIALKLPEETATYSFKYKNNRYVTAEPSGEGFDLGELGMDIKSVSLVVELY
jgi:hypothetical protein